MLLEDDVNVLNKETLPDQTNNNEVKFSDEYKLKSNNKSVSGELTSLSNKTPVKLSKIALSTVEKGYHLSVTIEHFDRQHDNGECFHYMTEPIQCKFTNPQEDSEQNLPVAIQSEDFFSSKSAIKKEIIHIKPAATKTKRASFNQALPSPMCTNMSNTNKILISYSEEKNVHSPKVPKFDKSVAASSNISNQFEFENNHILTSPSAYLSSVRRQRHLLPKRVSVPVKSRGQSFIDYKQQHKVSNEEDSLHKFTFLTELFNEDAWQIAVVENFAQCALTVYNIYSRRHASATYMNKKKDKLLEILDDDGDNGSEKTGCDEYFNVNSQDLLKSINFQSKPLISKIIKLSQCHILRLIDNIIDEVIQFGFDCNKGIWLYSLLAFLVKPLLPDTLGSLRMLAKYLISQYNEIESLKFPNDQSARLESALCIVCIIVRHFNQLDLLKSIY